MSDLYLSKGEHPIGDELDLDDGINYIARDGGFIVDPDENTITIPLAVLGGTADDMVANRRAILRKLRQAEQASGVHGTATPVTLGFRHETTEIIYYDVDEGEYITTLQYPGGTVEEGELILAVYPGTRYATVTDAVSSTLHNDDAPQLRSDVPGDRDTRRMKMTITDQTGSGAINKLHIARLGGDEAVAGDFDPIINAPAMSGASDIVDANAFGGDFARRSISSTTFVDLAEAIMPAGFLNKGRFDVWVRCRDNAVKMQKPLFLNGSVNAPSLPGSGISRRQTDDGSNTGTSVTATWGTTTLAGSLLTMMVKAQNATPPAISRRQDWDASNRSTSPAVTWGSTTLSGSLLGIILRFEGDYGDWTPPGGWEIAAAASNLGTPSVHTVLLYQENASPESGSESGGSFPGLTDWTMEIFEYENVATSDALLEVNAYAGDSAEAVTMAIQNLESKKAVLIAAIGESSDSSNFLGSWSNGFDQELERDGLATADRIVDMAGTYSTTANARTAAFDHASLIVSFAAEHNEPEPIAMTPPAGYSLGGIVENFDDPDTPVTTAIFYQQNAGVDSGNLTVNFDQSVTATCRIAEYTGIAETAALITIAERLTSGLYVGIGPTDIEDHPGTLALAIFGAYATGTSFSAYSGDFTEVGDVNGLAVAEATGGLSSWSVSAIASAEDAGAHLLAIFRDDTDPDDPESDPGELEPDDYDFRVRAIDASGNPSDATTTESVTVTDDGSSVDLDWSAPSGTISYYEVYWSRSGVVRKVNTPTNAVAYTLTSEANAIEVAALPSTSGGVASSNFLRGRFGLEAGGTTAWKSKRMERIGVWHKIHMGTFDAPAVVGLFDGTRPDWRFQTQAASGGGPAANVEIDAIWILAHDQPQLIVEADDEITTPRVWIIEQRPDGRIAAWLEDGVGNVVGRVDATGELSMTPGDNFLTVMAEKASGEFELVSAAWTQQIEFAAGYDAQAGLG